MSALSFDNHSGSAYHAWCHKRTGCGDKIGQDLCPLEAHTLDKEADKEQRQESTGKRKALTLLPQREGFKEEVTFQLSLESKAGRCCS